MIIFALRAHEIVELFATVLCGLSVCCTEALLLVTGKDSICFAFLSERQSVSCVSGAAHSNIVSDVHIFGETMYSSGLVSILWGGSPSAYLQWNAAPGGPDGKHMPPLSAPLFPPARLPRLPLFRYGLHTLPAHHLSSASPRRHAVISSSLNARRRPHVPFVCLGGMFAFLNSLGHCVFVGLLWGSTRKELTSTP